MCDTHLSVITSPYASFMSSDIVYSTVHWYCACWSGNETV